MTASGWAGAQSARPTDDTTTEITSLREALARGETPRLADVEPLVERALTRRSIPPGLERLLADLRAAEVRGMETTLASARDEDGQERSLLRSEQDAFDAAEDRVRRLDRLADDVRALAERQARVPASQMYTAEAAVERRVRAEHGLLDSPRATPPDALRAALDRLRGTGGAAPAAPTCWVPGLRELRADLSTGTGAAGGFLVPPAQASYVIDRLRQASVFLAAGPRVFDLADGAGGELRVPRMGTSIAAAMVAEGGTQTPADFALEQVVLRAHTGAALARGSRELFDDSNPAAREVIALDLERQLRDLLDAQCLAGTGTAPNCRGLRHFTGVNATELGSGDGAALGLDDVRQAIYRLEAKGATPSAIFLSARTWSALTQVKDGQQRYLLQPDPSGAAQRSIFGVRAFVSGRIATNETVGNSTTCAWLAVVDMSRVAVLLRQAVEVQLLQELYAANRQIGVAATIRFDVQPLDPAAIELVTGITN